MGRFKVDENLPQDVVDALRAGGHDARSVFDQGMSGVKDPRVAAVCRDEARCLITLDLDFGNIRDYPPAEYAGIVVLRLDDQAKRYVMQAVAALLPMLRDASLEGRLWIVDEGGLRVRVRG